MKKNILYFFCLLAVSANSQTVPTSVNFKTPEVNAFNRFVEAPVSFYTGVPNISIPLYEINIKGVSVPVTLNYHAGGIRVDQDATWVGLGWSLGYGGEVSRKMRGIPDEHHFILAGTNPALGVGQFMSLPNIGSSPDPVLHGERFEPMRMAKFGGADFMPDEFYYSALGYSGKFMFSQKDNQYILFPKEDIGVTNSPIVNRQLKSWNLKLPDGTSVDFGRDAYTTHDATIGNVPVTVLDSWLIKTIRNNYNDSITYTYDKSDYRLTKINGQSYKIGSISGYSGATSLQQAHIGDCKPRIINFPTGRIEFTSQTREDMPGLALSEIKIYNLNNVLIKTIKFNYGYFYGNSYEMLSLVNPIAAQGVSDNFRSKRLKLEGITILSGDEQPMKYAFDYNIGNIAPSKYSFSQDHWGFYNGIANTTLYGFIPNLDPHFRGGDRRVKPENSNMFSLKSIVYPEGGKREFIYENNSAGIWSIPSDLLLTYQDDNIVDQVAGISVNSYSRNTNYPEADQILDRTRYFRKRFTIPGGSYSSLGKSWEVSTNFGISELDRSTPYFANNVEFSLDAINTDGTRRRLRTFNTTSTGYPSDGTERRGIDTAMIGMGPGEYEMSVKMLYLNQPNSIADLQPYNLYFGVKWRQLNSASNMVNIGGLRVKEINDYDSYGTLVKKKSYKYVNPYANPNIPSFTSGRVVSFPQYHLNKMKFYYQGTGGTDWIDEFSSNSVLPLETTSGSFVGYEYVDEYDIDFTRPQNDLKTSYHFSFTEPYFGKDYLMKNTGLWESKEWARGKLLSKKYFEGTRLVKSEDFDYHYWSPHLNNDTEEDYVEEINTDFISYQALANNVPSTDKTGYPADFYDVSPTISGESCIYWYYYSYANHVLPLPAGRMACDYYTAVPYFKHNTAFDKLKSKIVKTYGYSSSDSIVQTETYNYGNTPAHHQLTGLLSSTSVNGISASITRYPQDISLVGDAETARLKLINNHQIATVLSQSTTKNASTITTKTDYKVDVATNLVVPAALKTNNTLTGFDEVRKTFLKFDDKGNILSSRQEMGMIVNYIWAYGGQFAVAEIKNTDYSTIENLLTKAGIDNFRNSSPDKTQVDAFLAILKNNISDIQVTSYVYNPLVGITSSTDPKGYTIFYEYDGFQRLKLIRDQNGNIVKSYNYNLAVKYRNKELSKVFTRNDCGSGSIGGTVIYRVAEGKYTEGSQDAADNMALNELNAMGQIYANQNASCTVCAGPDKKILNGTCETGNKIYTRSVRDTPTGNTYTCTYHYQWSDGSVSSNFLENRNGPCLPPQS